MLREVEAFSQPLLRLVPILKEKLKAPKDILRKSDIRL